MANVIINDINLTAIADAIRGKNGETTTYKPSEMATAITNLSTGGGDSGDNTILISGDCKNAFGTAFWCNFATTNSDKIVFDEISSYQRMFSGSTFETIPWDMDCIRYEGGGMKYTDNCQQMFYNSTSLKEITGKISLGRVNVLASMFYNCMNLRAIPEFEFQNYGTGASAGSDYNGMFRLCRSLRHIPSSFLKELYSQHNTGYNTVYREGFYNCFCLDEIVDLPVQGNDLSMANASQFSSNMFYNTFTNCARLKEITFSMKEDGTPYECNWTNQTIDLSVGVGYVNTYAIGLSDITNYNSGITTDKRVYYNSSSATPYSIYTSLKDDPDYYTDEVGFSRYDRKSAVNTINSLPDASATGGTNTIKLNRLAGNTKGSSSDATEMSKLSSAEIAVATAKGWTVTLV